MGTFRRMARPHKDDVEPITLAALTTALARLKYAHESIEQVARELQKDDVIYVSYCKSLDRGIERLEAFTPQLQRSLAMKKMGQPLQPKKSAKDQLSSKVEAESDEVFATAKRKIGQRIAKDSLQQPAKSGGKRQNPRG